MRKLLHIIATPREDESRTLSVSKAFLENFKKRYPDCEIETLDLFKENLPDLTVKMVGGKYVLLAGGDLAGEFKEAWKDIERYIGQFLSAEGYLVSAPMWNFSIPYALKQYIDIIVQPKYLFRYTEKGPEGLAKNKKMAVITTRGGDYSPESPFNKFDFQEPYLRAIFGFAGITDISFINGQPMDAMGPDTQKQRLEEAKRLARETALSW